MTMLRRVGQFIQDLRAIELIEEKDHVLFRENKEEPGTYMLTISTQDPYSRFYLKENYVAICKFVNQEFSDDELEIVECDFNRCSLKFKLKTTKKDS